MNRPDPEGSSRQTDLLLLTPDLEVAAAKQRPRVHGIDGSGRIDNDSTVANSYISRGHHCILLVQDLVDAGNGNPQGGSIFT